MSITYKNTNFENLGEIGRGSMITNKSNSQTIILMILGIATSVLIYSIILEYKNEQSKNKE